MTIKGQKEEGVDGVSVWSLWVVWDVYVLIYIRLE